LFDEAASDLDAHTAERFAQTVNQLKGKVPILFIAPQLPRGPQVDEVFTLSARRRRRCTLSTRGKPEMVTR